MSWRRTNKHIATLVRNGTWKVVGNELIKYIDTSMIARTSFGTVENKIGQEVIDAGKPYDADYALLSAEHVHIKEYASASLKAYIATYYVCGYSK